MTRLEALSKKNHPYKCNTRNFYSNEANEQYDNITEFLDEYEDADIDMNLVFRWDVHKTEDGEYYVEIFLILQRKGIFRPISIDSILEDDVERFETYLQKHKQKIDELWDLST